MSRLCKLRGYISKKTVRADTQAGFEKMTVLGVSNKLGITETTHKKSKDLSNYLVINQNDFAYNPYRINVGSIGITPQNISGLVSPAYVVFTTTDQLLPELLLDFLKSKEGLFQIGKYARGTVRKALRYEDLCEIEMPIPSIEEQRVILKKKNEIHLKVSALDKELGYQRALLQNLRKQILQDAIEGKLTADWRSDNSGYETAASLLERIATEKQRLFKEKKIKKQKSIPNISEKEKPFAIPEFWEWCRLGSIATGFQYGTSNKSIENGEVPVLRMGNIQNGQICWENLVFSNEKDEVEKFRLRAGDLLFNRTNSRELVGKTALFLEEREAIYAGYLVRFRPICDVQSKYCNIVLNSKMHSDWCKEVRTDAIGQSNINATKLSLFCFPLPPVSEQKVIVKLVEKLFGICDKLENRITKNQDCSELLIQTVLKEAFAETKSEGSGSVIEFKRHKIKKVDFYKRTLLAAEIVDQLHKEPKFGHLKLQKMIFLCQKTQNMQLPTNFLRQAAGPYDPKMARSLDRQFKEKKWFSYNKTANLKYQPLADAGAHKEDFQTYFENDIDAIQHLINLFKTKKSNEMEAVATLYACWEEILNDGVSFSKTKLIEKFYNWSEEKRKFSKRQLQQVIKWMEDHGICPSKSDAA